MPFVNCTLHQGDILHFFKGVIFADLGCRNTAVPRQAKSLLQHRLETGKQLGNSLGGVFLEG